MEGFYTVDNKLLRYDHQKGNSEKEFKKRMIYLVICSNENYQRIKNHQRGYVQLSTRTLIDDVYKFTGGLVNLNLRNANDYLKELEKEGLIECIKKSKSKCESSIYNVKSVTDTVTVNETVNETVETSNINALGDISVTVGVTDTVTGTVTTKKQKEKQKENKNNIFIEEKQNSISVTYMDLTFIEDHISDVRITEKEYNKLLEKYPKKLVHDKIELLDAYADNDKYDNHFKVLSLWCKKDKDNEKYKEQLTNKKRKKDPYAEIKEKYEQEDKYAMYKPKEPPVWVKDWT